MTALRAILGTTLGRLAAGAAVVAIVGVAVIAPRVGGGEPAAEVRTAPVARASVTQTVDVSGSVNAAAQLRLGFPTGGRLAELLVGVGAPVVAGQPLARLDTTDLEAALGQAEAALTSAQARYDATVAGISAQDLALAKVSLDDARRRYGEAQRSTSADLAAADVALSKAKASYENARATFATLTSAIASDVAAYRSAIPQIRTDVVDLRTHLDSLSRSSLTSAVRSLETASQDLATADTHGTFTLQPAADEYGSQAGVAIAAVATFDRAVADGTDTASANASLQAAKSALETAASKLTAALDAPGGEILQAETAVSSVHASLTSSDGGHVTDTALDGARADAVALQIAIEALQQRASSIRGAVTQASASLATLSEMVSGGYLNAVQAHETASARASTTLADQASALRSAELQYEKSTAAPKDADVASSYASLLQAQAAVVSARADLDGATLVAPSGGVVASIAAEAGETLTASTAAALIVLADTSALVLSGTVGETEVASLRIGQVATVLVDAVAGASMTGKITAIDPVATIQQGVPVYGVDVRIDVADAAVRAGMTGTATVIVANRADVLTVPNLAIRSQSGRRFVQVLREGKVEDATVAFGISNETVTEVMSGLEEGDEVVLPQPRTSAQQQVQNRLGGGTAPAGGVRVR